MECRHISPRGDVSTSDTLLSVVRSDACAVGRSGESLKAPCWQTILLVASPFASIDTMHGPMVHHDDGYNPVTHRAMQSVPTIGEGGDTAILSPERSSK